MNNIKLRCYDTERKEWNTSWIIQPDAVYRNMSDNVKDNPELLERK